MPPKLRLDTEPEKFESSDLTGILGLISFSTIIPLNIHTSIQEMARFTWFWPVIGGFIGMVVGLFGFVLLGLLHLYVLPAAALIYSFALWFTGFHHLDGLVDMGDGLMVHGNHEKKLSVMKDNQIGTGGIASFFLVALVTFASLSSIPSSLIFYALFVSEIAAKIGILSCCTVSKPSNYGIGRFFIESMDLKRLVVSLIISIFLGFLALKTVGVLGIIGGVMGGLLMAILARRNFGVATGDVLGASNEISRMLALLIIIIVSGWIP